MPYTGSDPNLIDLQSQITLLMNRVAALDGIGMSNPSLAVTVTQAAVIAGLKTTVNQVTLLLQQQIQDLKTAVTNLQTLVNSLTGS